MKTLPYYGLAIMTRALRESETADVIARIIHITGGNFQFMKKLLTRIEESSP